MTRFQILKGEQPKISDFDKLDKFVFEEGQNLKIRFIDTERIWKPPMHWVPLEGRFFDEPVSNT